MTKTEQKAQNDQKQVHVVVPFSTAEEEAPKPEQDASAEPNQALWSNTGKKYTTKEVALINESFYINDIVSELKMCKAKWKALVKRFEQSKKHSQSHNFNLYNDSD